MSRFTLQSLCLAGVLFALPGGASALQFPEVSCVTPAATVTEITGIDTSDAKMVGRYTLPDIQEGCSEGWVDQGGSQPPLTAST